MNIEGKEVFVKNAKRMKQEVHRFVITTGTNIIARSVWDQDFVFTKETNTVVKIAMVHKDVSMDVYTVYV